MKKSAVLCGLIVALCFVSCVSSSASPPTPRTAAGPPATRMAFIGNSYTFFQDLPSMLANLTAASGHHKMVHQQATPGGSSIFGHADNSTPAGVLTDKMFAPGAVFDYVVLQDQSETPGGGRDTDSGLPTGKGKNLSLAALSSYFAPRITRANAAALMYSTWGRRTPKTDDPKNADVYPTFMEMTRRTTEGYEDYATALHAHGIHTVVAPCGKAYEIIYNETKSPLSSGSRFDALYHTGSAGIGGHPSVLGTYLIANVMFSALYSKSSVGLPFVPQGIDAAEAKYLQGVAERAVFTKRIIPLTRTHSQAVE